MPPKNKSKPSTSKLPPVPEYIPSEACVEQHDVVGLPPQYCRSELAAFK